LATERQVAANAANAVKGGVKTPEGKALTRLNARKHGIFATALTQYDQEELHGIYDRFAEHLRPVGPVEDMLIEKLALTYLRLQRCARAEAEFHILTWEPDSDEFGEDPPAGRPELNTHACTFKQDYFENGVKLFARYDTGFTNQMIRLLHEIERLQRMRLGEDVPAPVAADVAVHLPATEHAAPAELPAATPPEPALSPRKNAFPGFPPPPLRHRRR
jgi:hypothetical protein